MHIPTYSCERLRNFRLHKNITFRNKKRVNQGSKRRANSGYIALISIFLLSANSHAQQSITLNDAIERTLQTHPDLRAFVYQAKAKQGLVTQANQPSLMTIDAKVEDVLGTGQFSALSGIKTNLSINWLLEEQLINARVNLANQEATLVAFEQQKKALDIAAKTASIFVTLLSQKEQLKLAKLSYSQSKTALKQVEKQVTRAKSNVVDQLRAKANVAKKELVVEDLTHEIEASRAKLAAQWQGNHGLGNDEFNIVGQLAEIPSVAEVESTYQQLKQHPTMMQLNAQQSVTDAAVTLAKVSEKPSWQLNAGIKHDNLNDSIGFTAGVSIPFGGENRNQGTIMALQAKQNIKQAEADAWKKHTSTQLLLLTHQLKHNRHVIEGLSINVIPALEEANQAAEQAYGIGRYRYSEWYDVQQALVSAQFELIEAYSNMHQLNIELQRLTGSSQQK